MRKIGLKDAFALARIIKSAGIRKEIISFANQIRTEQENTEQENTEQATAANSYIEKVGFEFFLMLIEAISDEKNEQKLYELYADIKGVSPDDIALLGFAEIKADMQELIEQNDLKNFFQSLSALMSKQ